MFTDVIELLQQRLAMPLPGATAHAHLAPVPRRPWPTGVNAIRIRDAAGLLLLFPLDGRARIVLTERAHTLDRHGGQISLPGGVVDPGETFEHTALREAREEIGLMTDTVRVLGSLSPIDIPVSGFCLHPIVATIDSKPELTPAAHEVARIVDVGLDELRHESNLATTLRQRDGVDISVPVFRVSGLEIWGATAMILAELLVLLGWRPAASG